MAKLKGLTVEIGGDTTKLGKALEDVNKKSRDVSSELGEINKLLKIDPTSTSLLAQKQKVLGDAISTTSDKLRTLKEAEKQVQKQFERGEASEEQVRALQREIIQTEKKMESYEGALKDTTKQLKNHGKSSDEVKEKTKKFGEAAKTAGEAAVKAFAAVAAAVAAAAGALAKASVDAAAYADNILTASTVTGISTEKLQEYTYAAELVDVSVDTLTKSHAKQIKSMKAVQDGTKLAVDAYKKLGVEVMNNDGTLRDGETVYWEVIEALGKMENETERDAIAMQILGKSAQELNPLIEAGSEKMNELAKEAHDVGAVMSTETLESFGAFDDSIQRLKGSAGAAKNALGTVLLPELTALSGAGAALLADFAKNIDASGGGLDGFVATVESMAGEIGSKAGEILGSLVTRVTEIIPGLVSVAISLVESLGTAIIEALPGVVVMIIDMLVKNVPKLLDAALTLLMALVDAVDVLLPQLIKALPSIIKCILDGLMGAIPQILDAAVQLLLAVCDAIPILIETLVPMIPQIITTIVMGLLDATPKLIQAAFTLFQSIPKTIPKACAELVKALPQIWKTMSSYFSQLPKKLLAIGGELVAGLWQGINNKATWLKNKIKSWVGNVTSFLKKLFGINSPSKVTAYMGEMLDEGLAVGIEDNATAPKKAMRDMTESVLDGVGLVDGAAIERNVVHTYSVSAAANASQNAGLLGKLDAILKAIEDGQVLVLDGDAVVGGTANKMNNVLGQRRVLAGRSAL